MKKIILSLFAITSGAVAFGQSAQFDNPESVASGILADNVIEVHWNVINGGTSQITFEVAREVLTEVSGSSNDFCWTYCYPTHVDTSLVNSQLAPGQTDTTFAAHYKHNGNVGTTSIRYHFYNEKNRSDINSYDVHFCIGNTIADCNGIGIDEVAKGSINEAYPNPANEIVNISYRVDRSASSAKVIVYNLLGEKVIDSRVELGHGFVVLGTSGLNAGTYFYSLVVDGEITGTQKLIVSH